MIPVEQIIARKISDRFYRRGLRESMEIKCRAISTSCFCSNEFLDSARAYSELHSEWIIIVP